MNNIARYAAASALLFASILGARVHAQDISVDSRAKAQADTSVRVQGNGDISIQTRSKAEAESSVIINQGPPAVQKRSPKGDPSLSGAGAPRETPLQMRGNPQSSGPAGVGPSPPNFDAGYTSSQPLIGGGAPLQPGQGAPNGGAIPGTGDQANAAPARPRPRPPLPCKQTVTVEDGDIRVTIINNYCLAQIVNILVWREGGKTRLQFDVDNTKGGRQAHLRMVEKWSDLRGRAAADPIDEQRVAIEGGHVRVVSIAAPVPQAMVGVITLYK